MNLKFKALGAISAIVLLVGIFIFLDPSEKVEHFDPDPPMGIGVPDDPYGRVQWDILRMKDPVLGHIPDGIRGKELKFAKTLPNKATSKINNWELRGPRNEGGRTRAIAVDIQDDNIMLAGGVTGGVWRTTDNGASWIKTTDPAQIHSVSSIVQDTRAGHEDTWYYGSGENYGIVSGTGFSVLMGGDGIFKSTDGGQSWTHVPSTISNSPQIYVQNGTFKRVNSIVIDPTDLVNDVVLAAVYDGIYRSTDGGATWAAVLGVDTTSSAHSNYSELEVTRDGVFYASFSDGGPNEGLWRSVDGINWTNIASIWPANARRTVIGVDPSNENIVYWFGETPGAGTNGHSLHKYRYLSGDGSGAGGMWENRSANLPNGECTGYFNFDFAPINTQSSYDMCIAVHPTDTNTLFIGGTNVYRSTDAFATANSFSWIGGYFCDVNDPKNYVYPGHHPDQQAMTFKHNDPSKLVSGSDGGVAITADCMADPVVWDDRNNGYFTTQFYTVSIEEGDVDSDFIMGGLQDNGTWLALDDDVNNDWANPHGDDGAYCAIPLGRQFYLMTSQRGRLYKKELDVNGNVLAFERIDPTLGTNNYNFINQFILDPHDNNKCYWVSASRLWRNNDLAGIPLNDNYYDRIDTNWELVSDLNLPASQRISTLDISRAQPGTIFYGTQNARLYRGDSLYNGTTTKTEVTSPLFPTGAYMSCIAPNHFDGDEWIATFSNYGVKSIFRTTDGGTSWESISGNLEENSDGSGNGPAVFWASIYPTWDNTENQYFIGTSTGLYSTDLLDGDNTIWSLEGPTSIGNVVINMMKIRNYDGLMVVGTHGNGIYSGFLDPAPISVEENTLNGELSIYPNPASDQVTFELKGITGAFELRILDVNGKRVHTKNGLRAHDGVLRYQWSFQVPDGMYLAELVIEGQRIAAKKMMIQR